ncbi:MAG: acyl--CoA ligase [Flavobacteriaceae bacterium]|nr:acyl--CoA ligase [Flavobacteriaceae bacterium]
MSLIKNWIVQFVLNRFKIPRDMIRYAFKKHSENKAIITENSTLTFQELAKRVYSLSTGLSAMEIEKRDSVLVLVSNGINQIEINLACYEMGAILTPLNINITTNKILDIAKLINPKLLIYDAKVANKIAQLLQQHFPDLKLLEIDSNYNHLIASYPSNKNKNKISPDDIAALGFTSGTTGNPKALPATHGVFVKSLQLIVKNVGIGSKKKNSDKFLVGIPLAGAGSGVVLPSLLSGSALVIPKSYNSEVFLETIQKHKVTRMFTTPSLLIDILDHPDLESFDLSSLENIIYGTETLAAAKLEEAIEKFGPILQQGYGSAEVLPPVSMLQPKDHIVNHKIANRNILTSVGKVVPQVSVKIVDDDHNDLPFKETGHVLIKSPTLFTGYWKQPELNTKTFVDGWLKIGDMGYLEADGRLHILGRSADVIKKGNQIIYPRLIEEHVHDHPAIKECNLVQVDNEAVLAVSLRQAYRKNTNHETIAFEILNVLKNKIKPYQLPDDIEFFEELPRSFLAKVLRCEVREFLKTKNKIAI